MAPNTRLQPVSIASGMALKPGRFSRVNEALWLAAEPRSRQPMGIKRTSSTRRGSCAFRRAFREKMRKFR